MRLFLIASCEINRLIYAQIHQTGRRIDGQRVACFAVNLQLEETGLSASDMKIFRQASYFMESELATVAFLFQRNGLSTRHQARGLHID